MQWRHGRPRPRELWLSPEPRILIGMEGETCPYGVREHVLESSLHVIGFPHSAVKSFFLPQRSFSSEVLINPVRRHAFDFLQYLGNANLSGLIE